MKRIALGIGAVALWYTLNSGPGYKTSQQKYHLPPKIQVIEASFQNKTGEIIQIKNGNAHTNKEKATSKLKDLNQKDKIILSQSNLTPNLKELKSRQNLEDVLYTSEIDFSKHFRIKTDRYVLEKGDDWMGSQVIGNIASVPGKILFWDSGYGEGLDGNKSRTVLCVLENNKKIKDINVRLNYNRVWYDLYRLFADKKVTKRNPFLIRATFGVFSVLGSELLAELSRGAYYNPFTQTVATYANIEAVADHEIGHHLDFERFDTDWIYAVSRYIPPVALYQEWVASQNAKTLLSKDDKYQFNRYLIPAFATYVLGFLSLLTKHKKQN